MIIWNTYRDKTIFPTEHYTSTSSYSEISVSPEGFTENYSLATNARDVSSNISSQERDAESSFYRSSIEGFEHGGTTDLSTLEQGITSSSSQHLSTDSRYYSITFTTDYGMGAGEETATDTSSTFHTFSTSNAGTFPYTFNYKTTMENTFTIPVNTTAEVDTTTSIFTVIEGALGATTETLRAVSNYTTTTSLYEGNPVTYDTAITKPITITNTVPYETTRSSDKEVELGTFLSTEYNDWLWTFTADLLDARITPDLTIGLVSDRALSVEEVQTLWPVVVASSRTLYQFDGAFPTGQTTYDWQSTITLTNTKVLDDVTQNYTIVDFPPRSEWTWTELTANSNPYVTTSETSVLGSAVTLVGGQSSSQSRFETATVSCLTPLSSSITFSGLDTHAYAQTSKTYRSATSYYVLPDFQSHYASHTELPDFTSSVEGGAVLSATDTHLVVFDYASFEQRRDNYISIAPYQAFLSPRLYREDATKWITDAGTNLKFGGDTLFYPFSVSVMRNLVTPYPLNTTAFDDTNSFKYTYKWSFDSVSPANTLSYSKQHATGGLVTTSEGAFSEVSHQNQYMTLGNAIVGGNLEGQGMESVTYYPGGYRFTQIDGGNNSSTFTTIFTTIESTATADQMFTDNYIPALITYVKFDAISDGGFDPVTVFTRNSDRYHGDD